MSMIVRFRISRSIGSTREWRCGAGHTYLDDDDLPVHGIRGRDILCQGDYDDTTTILGLDLGSREGDDLGCAALTDRGGRTLDQRSSPCSITKENSNRLTCESSRSSSSGDGDHIHPLTLPRHRPPARVHLGDGGGDVLGDDPDDRSRGDRPRSRVPGRSRIGVDTGARRDRGRCRRRTRWIRVLGDRGRPGRLNGGRAAGRRSRCRLRPRCLSI